MRGPSFRLRATWYPPIKLMLSDKRHPIIGAAYPTLSNSMPSAESSTIECFPLFRSKCDTTLENYYSTLLELAACWLTAVACALTAALRSLRAVPSCMGILRPVKAETAFR